MAALHITAQKLIEILKISSQDLIDIEHFFDSIPDDDWELIEGKDYKVVIQSTGLREYTESGAYTIARYLDSTRNSTLWDRLVEWITHTHREIRRSFIKQKNLNNCSSLVKRNNQFFVSRSDVVAIFGTRSDYLRKMADYTQKTQHPLIKGQDYEDFIDEGGLHFSVSGIYKLAQAFGESLTKKNRREECKEIGAVVELQIKDIVKQIIDRENQIKTVMQRVKKRDKKTCQVTGEKFNAVNNLKLAAHHLYSQKEYPYLADVENNLITLSCTVHDQFHQNYMGGNCKRCTIDDFISFVQKYYPENSSVIIWLERQKLVLGNPQPVDVRKPHVLYLPASKVI